MKLTMELMTDELRKKFKEIGNQSDIENPIVIVKYFNPCGAGTWWITEFDDKDNLFGYVTLGFGDACDEWGNISLTELQSFKSMFGLGIERDLYCDTPKPISEFKECSYNRKRKEY